jgi:hypothetical protein
MSGFAPGVATRGTFLCDDQLCSGVAAAAEAGAVLDFLKPLTMIVISGTRISGSALLRG